MMSAIVSLRAVINEMEALSDEDTAYLNQKTGELITFISPAQSIPLTSPVPGRNLSPQGSIREFPCPGLFTMRRGRDPSRPEEYLEEDKV